jgi:hypothetical protein
MFWPVRSIRDQGREYAHDINLVTCVHESLGFLFYDRGPLCFPDTYEAIEPTFSASLLALAAARSVRKQQKFLSRHPAH